MVKFHKELIYPLQSEGLYSIRVDTEKTELF